jgi:hypothetical protein
MIIAPSFFEKDGRIEKHYDLFSRLLKDRIVLRAWEHSFWLQALRAKDMPSLTAR